MSRHSLGVLSWLLSQDKRQRHVAVTLAQRSAEAGSPFGHFTLYNFWRDEEHHRALMHLELACSLEDRQLGDICFL